MVLSKWPLHRQPWARLIGAALVPWTILLRLRLGSLPRVSGFGGRTMAAASEGPSVCMIVYISHTDVLTGVHDLTLCFGRGAPQMLPRSGSRGGRLSSATLLPARWVLSLSPSSSSSSSTSCLSVMSPLSHAHPPHPSTVVWPRTVRPSEGMQHAYLDPVMKSDSCTPHAITKGMQACSRHSLIFVRLVAPGGGWHYPDDAGAAVDAQDAAGPDGGHRHHQRRPLHPPRGTCAHVT
jgi:hypothetical protein